MRRIPLKEKLKITVDENGKTTVWMDGEIVKGIKEIEFNYEAGDYPTHRITYITQKASH
jgi:hypothetical protein